MQLECLSTNSNHLARVEVFVVLCVISPYFIIALPHFSKLVKVTFGNFTSVTIMSNKVIAFKFPFERAGPHSTESNDLSKYFSAVPDSCIQFDKKMVTHTFVALPNAKNIAHICTNTKHKGPERTSKSNKINLIDKVSYPSE